MQRLSSPLQQQWDDELDSFSLLSLSLEKKKTKKHRGCQAPYNKQELRANEPGSREYYCWILLFLREVILKLLSRLENFKTFK